MICGMCLRKQLVSKSTPLRTFATRHSPLQQHSARPLKLAIIGAGPSGFYAASRLLALLPADLPEGAKVQVDMYERLPTPYGLARYGVAPDHPEVKNCQHKFDELSTDSRFRYFGNTSIGTQSSSSSTSTSPITSLSTYTYPHALHVPLSSLIPHYTSILFTYGSSLSNPLSSVPGSSSSQSPLEGVFPALALVGWYNGHPAFRHNAPDLSRTTDVSIIGHGNVALDVARILLKPVESLSETDLPEDVLDVLAKSKVRSVRVVGRRGPAQVAFTAKEFREMSQLGLHRAGLDPKLAAEARSIVGRDRARNRILDLMEKPWSAPGNGKEFHLDFLKSPKSFNAASESTNNDKSSRVGSVTWSVNELLTTAADPPSPPTSQTESVPQPSPTVIARPTDETVTTPADLVVESVGYRSEPLGSEEGWTLPFDRSRGRVRNVGGRVVDEEGMVVPGLYAAGWVARGPVGVIASTMHDAYSLVSIMIDDHLNTAQTSIGVPQLGSNLDLGLPDLVEAGLKEGKVVTLDGWHKIDAAEVERARGAKPREKFTRVEDMLAVLS